MILIRRSSDRGHFDHGWLDTRHTFSFADYYDPRHRGFGHLRVMNEDRVQPGAGFGTHPHRNMEIITFVLDGTLEHKDSMGNGTKINRDEVQRITAGIGITHSEFNPSQTDPVHFYQIWIEPRRPDLEPGYEQKAFPVAGRLNRLELLASADGRDESITIEQDAFVYGLALEPGKGVTQPIAGGRRAWLQVVRGGVTLNGHGLHEGDGVAVENEAVLEIVSAGGGEALLLDLP